MSRDLSPLLLLEPITPARVTFDEAKLFELIESIKQFGVLEPLLVFPDGDAYRVAAGHRRLVAARALELETVPCRIFPDGASVQEAIKHHENKVREDLNPADQACYFERLLESECDGDVDKLAALVGERRVYVEDRLLLKMGDPQVFEALQAGTIKIGVAQELNLVKDRGRRVMYLDAAMQGGATINMVRGWRIKGNADDIAYPMDGVLPEQTESPLPKRAVGTTPACILCTSTADQWEMEIMFAHKSCIRREERIKETASDTTQSADTASA